MSFHILTGQPAITILKVKELLKVQLLVFVRKSVCKFLIFKYFSIEKKHI